jgi:hypothetical protein
MASQVISSPQYGKTELVHIKVYYGASADFTEAAFVSALSACGLSRQDAYYVYGINAPHIPDENGLVPPQGACISIFSSANSQLSTQLVETFRRSMTQYEAPLPLQLPTTALDAIAAAMASNN